MKKMMKWLFPMLSFACLAGCGSVSNDPIEYNAKEVSVDDFTMNYYEDRGGWLIEDYRGKETEIILPSVYKGERVVAVGKYAFKDRNIKTIVLSDTIVRLDDYAFVGSGVENLIVTPRLDSFSENAFDYSSVKFYEYDSALYLPTTTARYGYLIEFKSVDKGYTLPEGCVGIISWASDKALFKKFPQARNGLELVTYVNRAELSFTVNLPSSISVIKYNLAMKVAMPGVKEVTLHNLDSAFGGIKSDTLEKVHLDLWYTSIPLMAFTYCKKLKEVTIEEGCTEIEDYAFYKCNKIERLKIPGSCKRVGNDCLRGCSSLNVLELEKWNVTSISKLFNSGDNRWGSDDTLSYYYEHIIVNDSIPDEAMCSLGQTVKELRFGEGCTSIGINAVSKNYSVEKIHLPKSLKAIGSGAFSDLNYLKKVTYAGSQAEWNKVTGRFCFPSTITVECLG